MSDDEQRTVTVWVEGEPVDVTGFPDEPGADDQQILIDADEVDKILTVWMENAPDDTDRNFTKTTGRDYVMGATFTDGLTLSLEEWPEAGDFTYYLNSGPISWSPETEED